MSSLSISRLAATLATTILILTALLGGSITLAAQGEGDTSNGATNYNFHGAGRWWRDIGPESELTTFDGPFRNTAGPPSQIYMTFWKEPEPGNSTGLSPALDASHFQIKHSLGTTFYYPAGQPAPPDPSKRGYTANDFTRADNLVSSFPEIHSEFQKGFHVSGCHRGKIQFFLLRGRDTTGAFLVGWMPEQKQINVAVMPSRALKGSFASVLDHLDYYQSGGMVEFVEFSAYFYYLSRLPASANLDMAPNGTAAQSCPPTPIATKSGMQFPKGWTQALKALKSSDGS